MTTKPTTLVTFLLDKSGSMNDIWDETIGGFNAYLDTLRAESTGLTVLFTRLQFDTGGIVKDYVAAPLADVQPLTRSNYVPQGGTPLIDAAYETVGAVEASLSKYDVKPKVIVCIQTDGQENSSRHHTWSELKELIGRKTADGWQFNFMGTGIDAYDQGAQMGISAANTMSTGKSTAEVRASFRAAGASAMRFASGRADTAAYLSSERAASGDRFAPVDLTSPKAATPAAPTSAPSGRLDLTAPGSARVTDKRFGLRL